MGKRTKDKTDEEIERKIRRLEKELKSREKQPSTDSRNEGRAEDDDASFHASSYDFYDEIMLDEYLADEAPRHESAPNIALESISNANATPAQGASTSADENAADLTQHTYPQALKTIQSTVTVCPTSELAVEDSIPEEILEALGEAKKSEEIFGKKISQEVSERLGKILVDGLAKEQKENLLSKTLIPENFLLSKAPKLNTEVTSVLTEPSKNRDKRLEALQNQLGSGIAGLVNLTTDLINKDLDKIEIIKRISEANQIFLDLHHENTISRRRLIIPLLDKSFISIIHNVKRDQYLFGEKLGEKIQNTKSIEKTSLQIKKAVPQLPSYRKTQGHQGNSRPPVRQGPGTMRTHAQASTSRYYPPPPPPAAYRKPPPARRPPPPSTTYRSKGEPNPQDHRGRRR